MLELLERRPPLQRDGGLDLRPGKRSAGASSDAELRDEIHVVVGIHRPDDDAMPVTGPEVATTDSIRRPTPDVLLVTKIC